MGNLMNELLEMASAGSLEDVLKAHEAMRIEQKAASTINVDEAVKLSYTNAHRLGEVIQACTTYRQLCTLHGNNWSVIRHTEILRHAYNNRVKAVGTDS